ncbi:Centromere protein I-like protein [Emericellopsis cladophorae]|uniref:Centromere protein I-like protein n=1 Tax=Emericellopsis cladophorae TaxID=2686198 RepID=A0A9Q0BFI7_9HYPO|nr:Centromere protein I-like protein [Emericellopsis cladophorae]KAI6782946.1 Centromere protein I-like protein [Emericellopsis cladophorae]
MMEDSAVDEELNRLIQDVVDAAKLTPKARLTDIKPTVARLNSAAYGRGVLPDALDKLIDLITRPSHLDQGSLNVLVRNLYPATKVSRHVVIRIIACLGQGRFKASLNIQAALVRWLILVYRTLETPQVLSQSYHVLFSLLDTAATRPQLAHLLALITRRKHVKPFRIQALLDLARKAGNDPSLIGLLRVYKDYYPEVIVGEAHPDTSWREHLNEVQDAHLHRSVDTATITRDGFRVNKPLGRERSDKAIPAVHTSLAGENSVTLEEVETAKGLADSLEKLELPNQLVAVLADPLLQKLLLLRPHDEAHQRVAYWLQAALQEVMHGAADEATLWELLEVVRDFVTQTKAIPPILLNFFAHFFPVWGGTGRVDVLLDILAFTPLKEFNELYQHLFGPLETALGTHRPELQPSLVDLYTQILQHWKSLLLSSDVIPKHAKKTIQALVSHMNSISSLMLQASPTVATSSHVLDFYEEFARTVTHSSLRSHLRIEMPPSPVIYSLFFSGSLADTSRLCHVLSCFKQGFETAIMERARSDDPTQSGPYDRAYLNTYNGYLMDICNCLWRTRAFSSTEANAHGCLLPPPTVDALSAYLARVNRNFGLESICGLSLAPTLCFQSIQRFRELEDAELDRGRPLATRHAGPVTQASLAKLATSGGLSMGWQDYRVSVLNSLSDKGLPGIADLLKCTMTVLKNLMDGKTGERSSSLQRSSQ